MTSNFSYPRPEPPQAHQHQNNDGRDSLGSTASAPGMVEDTGSEASAEGEFTRSGLWNSFFEFDPNKKRLAYPAVITEGLTAVAREDRPRTRGRECHTTSGGNTPTPSPASSATERSRTPKPSKSYKLFPPAVVGHPHVRLPISPPEEQTRQPSSLQAQSSYGSGLPATTVAANKNNNNNNNNNNSQTTEMNDSSSVLDKYSDPEDMPILELMWRYGEEVVRERWPHRLYLPDRGDLDRYDRSNCSSRGCCTPPHLPRPDTGCEQAHSPRSPEIPVSPMSRAAIRREKVLPEPPRAPAPAPKPRPSHMSLRNFSFSKMTTRSTPALAHQADNQTANTCSAASYMDRPLPPLPPTAATTTTGTSHNPTPPNISVFEVDSDDEDESFGGESMSLARRILRGIVPSSNSGRRARSDAGLTHQRTQDGRAQQKSGNKFWNLMRGRSKSTSAPVSSMVVGPTAAERERHFNMLMSLSMSDGSGFRGYHGHSFAAKQRRPSSSRGAGMSLSRRIFGSTGGR
ncbi:hypothetical protein QBC38DRAFT_90253 [Podospora fimiseda]|uniref:Uncharacterized protein n=1 Tax=Podospora fimiseda TaxID=252190 RepID=A0AAN7H5V8_9PEZI|nr:hypothetical protein QBC38DRAFT_90253 [Podospora fimiseda]